MEKTKMQRDLLVHAIEGSDKRRYFSSAIWSNLSILFYSPAPRIVS